VSVTTVTATGTAAVGSLEVDLSKCSRNAHLHPEIFIFERKVHRCPFRVEVITVAASS
jgi:hypothetical protein